MLIELTQDKNAIVDDLDKDLDNLNWCADSHGYAKRTKTFKGKKITIRMHQVIAGRMYGFVPKGTGKIVIDHINGNKLDNRRDNLRIVSASDNLQNRGPARSNRSGYKGVSIYQSNGYVRFRASCTIKGKLYHCGYFDNAEEANQAVMAKRAILLELSCPNVSLDVAKTMQYQYDKNPWQYMYDYIWNPPIGK